MPKWVFVISGSTVLILLMLFVVLSYTEGKLDYSVVDMESDSSLTSPKATCNNYHGEVISTIAKLEDYLQDCEITKDVGYDAEYFIDNVFIVYQYYDKSCHEPRAFKDYMFNVEGNEVITVNNKFSMSCSDDISWNHYLIEMGKNMVSTSNILFD